MVVWNVYRTRLFTRPLVAINAPVVRVNGNAMDYSRPR